MTTVSFWHWLFKGGGAKPGYRRLLDKWFIGHIFMAAILTILVQQSLKESANTVLLPLSGALIGLSFAWAGNAQALLQTSEIEQLSRFRPGGFQEYAYVYQTAILVLLVTVVERT